MFGNLISFLVLIALVVLFGWLAFRSWKSGRWFVKWPGVIVGGLLTLVFAAVTFFAGKGLAFAYIPPAPAPDLTVEGTAEQIARGKYLVGIACISCHGADGERAFPPTGGTDFGAEIPIPIGSLVSANLTPGGILAERTDGELFRAIRYGFGKGQRAGLMTFMPFRQLSDEDTLAIIAFLRSQEPAQTATNGGDDTNILGMIMLYGAGLQPLPETTEGVITAPAQAVTPEYGKYVATLGECRGCHGPDMTGAEATPFTPAVPNPRPYDSTLTTEEFIQMMRTGVRPNGAPLAAGMPWENASAMTDDDLAALHAYLTASP